MRTTLNEHGEFTYPEPESPYAAIMRFDVDGERERNLYAHEMRLRSRIRRLHAMRRQA